ncbi:MAG: type I restriction enzyme HsdR N-terminal domain-containing protein [Nostoc sp. NMS7]|uniref:type I restriction enzyme HsdR N-terminal domain-containing protein n=1 Tax=unclassified Nostoc TaxID=2593658 RepID=UPI0025E8BA60|nr:MULTISPECIES: type I restriction enzyme HsdR N-terminal domain-containing protein [unclassified Nostoc]MBN3874824.1 type I restriction enzyme HsdR N-terminal domain-containing protein [Nostoc sp. JL33]MBN3949657.1 type I restriction enzyme HsdR N-terminal domain-containing protein [Nostoc sp. NMS7]
MTSLSEEISRKLNIYKIDYAEYTKCLIRRREIVLDGRPEEKIRQLFLYFLVNQSGLFPNKIDIRVESDNHDIELYKTAENEYFKPYLPPLMIVEVKREEENLRNHEKQIERYLKQSCSEIGILYNYHQIIAYIKKDGVFMSNTLNNLEDIPALILQSSNKLDKNILEFEKAVNGSFDSFVYLVNKYGKYKLNRIVFRLKGEQLPIVGSFFKFQENKLYYNIYVQDVQKQQSCDLQDFEKLVSIIY